MAIAGLRSTLYGLLLVTTAIAATKLDSLPATALVSALPSGIGGIVGLLSMEGRWLVVLVIPILSHAMNQRFVVSVIGIIAASIVTSFARPSGVLSATDWILGIGSIVTELILIGGPALILELLFRSIARNEERSQ